MLPDQPAKSKLRYETILDGVARMLVNLRLIGVKANRSHFKNPTETRFLLDSEKRL